MTRSDTSTTCWTAGSSACSQPSSFATEVGDIFASGNRIVGRLTHRATGAGVFRSRIETHDVTRRSLTWGAIAIFRMHNGKIIEQWVNRDELGILSTAGVLAAPAGAP